MREGKRGSGSGGGGRRVKHNLVFVLHNCLCVIPWNPSIVLLAAAEEMEHKNNEPSLSASLPLP